MSALILVFAALAYWKWQSPLAAGILASIAIVMLLVYSFVPSTRRPIYQGFRKITHPIQLIMTAIILGVVYYVILTPIGCLLRFRGIDVRSKPGDDESYWTPRTESKDPSSYFRTY